MNGDTDDGKNSMSTAPPDLHSIIWSRYISLLQIKRRIYFLRAFQNDLESTTRSKPFRIRNGIVWMMILDTRDKCVIDLYSLTVEMRHGIPASNQSVWGNKKKKRGLFIEIRDHHLAALSRIYTQTSGDDDRDIEVGRRAKAALFAKLFPDCGCDSPSSADVEALCERFRLDMRALGTDRNKNRAHAYEGDVGQAPMSSVELLALFFAQIEDMLESLSLVSGGACFSRDDLNDGDTRETAVDLVDQVLLGNVHEVQRTYADRPREELYARLHEIDDAAQESERGTSFSSPDYFNDRQFAPPFVDFVVRAATEADVRAGRRAR